MSRDCQVLGLKKGGCEHTRGQHRMNLPNLRLFDDIISEWGPIGPLLQTNGLLFIRYRIEFGAIRRYY